MKFTNFNQDYVLTLSDLWIIQYEIERYRNVGIKEITKQVDHINNGKAGQETVIESIYQLIEKDLYSYAKKAKAKQIDKKYGITTYITKTQSKLILNIFSSKRNINKKVRLLLETLGADISRNEDVATYTETYSFDDDIDKNRIKEIITKFEYYLALHQSESIVFFDLLVENYNTTGHIFNEKKLKKGLDSNSDVHLALTKTCVTVINEKLITQKDLLKWYCDIKHSLPNQTNEKKNITVKIKESKKITDLQCMKNICLNNKPFELISDGKQYVPNKHMFYLNADKFDIDKLRWDILIKPNNQSIKYTLAQNEIFVVDIGSVLNFIDNETDITQGIHSSVIKWYGKTIKIKRCFHTENLSQLLYNNIYSAKSILDMDIRIAIMYVLSTLFDLIIGQSNDYMYVALPKQDMINVNSIELKLSYLNNKTLYLPILPKQ